ncbi:MAG: hypothetical protein ACRC1H_04730, partial [Caldilineaceae bacterium]
MSERSYPLRLVRFSHPAAGERVGVYLGADADAPLRDVTRRISSLEAWLHASVGRVALAMADLYAAADDAPTVSAAEITILPPVDTQEV